MKQLFLIAMLFVAVKCHSQLKDLVPVYRWYIPAEKGYCTIPKGAYSDKQLIKKGWIDKTFLFYAYRKPAAGRVEVYSWYNPTTNAYISVAGDEFTDEQMKQHGYQHKHFQYYAPIHGEAGAVPIYRWLVPERHLWITTPEGSDLATVEAKGCRHRTYQYYGILRP